MPENNLPAVERQPTPLAKRLTCRQAPMRKAEGRIKQKLRSLFLGLGYEIDFFWEQQGYWRRTDLARWGAYTVDTLSISFHCWNTMAECVLRGFELSPRGPFEFEVSANDVTSLQGTLASIPPQAEKEK